MRDTFRAFAPTNLPVTHCSLLGLQGQVPQWLTDPTALTQIYASLCTAQVQPPSLPPMDAGTCQVTYLLGLSQARALQEQSVAAKTLQQRHKNARELADWLQSTNIGRTLHSCLPEDIMVYLTTHWLPRHAGTTTKSGHKLAAPGSLSGVKSSPATELEQLG